MANSKGAFRETQAAPIRCARAACAPASAPAVRVRGALAQRRLDPRVSVAILVLLNAIAFSPNTMGAHFVMVGLCAVVCVWCGRAASAARWCAVYAAVTAVGYLSLLAPSSASASFAVILVVVRCVFCIGMFASNMIATTCVGELACALQRVYLPRHAIIALCVALRFFPTMTAEFASVVEAMRVRGVPLGVRMVTTHPVRVMEGLLVPVMSRLAIVADELGNAATVRGMDSSRLRTSYYDLRLRAMDWIMLVAFSAVAAFLLGVRMGWWFA
ncbi:energy-coupling factor transporter transmembrane component T [Rubneribacter sp.]